MQVERPDGRSAGVAGLLAVLGEAHARLAADDHEQRHFCGMYLRNTCAVSEELARGGFSDPDWVERWTVAFADLYLEELGSWQRGDPAALPWQLAFEAGSGVSPLAHQLIGLNAHLNFDLPQAVLAVVSDEEFADEGSLAQRRADSEHIDALVVRRVPEEYRYLRGVGGPMRQEFLARVLYPLNLAASRRWLVAARRSVWHNAMQLSLARRSGAVALTRRIADLEVLCAAKVAELLRPGQVVLRLAATGFGVTLPSAPGRRHGATDRLEVNGTPPEEVRRG